MLFSDDAVLWCGCVKLQKYGDIERRSMDLLWMMIEIRCSKFWWINHSIPLVHISRYEKKRDNIWRVSSTLVYVTYKSICVSVCVYNNITISVMCAISVYVKRHESSTIFNHGNEHLKHSITIEVGHSNRMIEEKNSRIYFAISLRFSAEFITFDSNTHKIARACIKNLLNSFRNGIHFLFSHILRCLRLKWKS